MGDILCMIPMLPKGEVGAPQWERPHSFFCLQSVMTYCRSHAIGYQCYDRFYRNKALNNIVCDERERE